MHQSLSFSLPAPHPCPSGEARNQIPGEGSGRWRPESGGEIRPNKGDDPDGGWLVASEPPGMPFTLEWRNIEGCYGMNGA